MASSRNNDSRQKPKKRTFQKKAKKVWNNTKRVISVVDTGAGVSILLMAAYWFTWAVNIKYMAVVDNNIVLYNKEIVQTTWIVAVGLSVLAVLLRYRNLVNRKLKTNIIFILLPIPVFVGLEYYLINYLCNKYDIAEYILNFK